MRHPGRYSHYVLLDHQDWLAGHDPQGLAQEWRLILANSRPGTRILFRSAAPEVDFLPPFVGEQVRFDPERTAALHARDRVGTYGSLHLAVVDFHGSSFAWFRRWMALNHVRMDCHLWPRLHTVCRPVQARVRPAWGGLWQYFVFMGQRGTV